MLLLAMESMGFGGFWTGVADVGMEKTIERLGLDGITPVMFSTGGGGGARLGRAFIGGAGFGASVSVLKNGITYEVGYGGGFFRFGYYPVIAEHFQLALIGGIGGVDYEITMKKNSKAVNFTELENQMRTTGNVTVGKLDLTTGATTGMLGVSLEFPLRWVGKRPANEKGEGYFLLMPAIEVGAIYIPPLSPWEGPGIVVEGLPTPNEGMPVNFYVLFTIYFGGGGRD